MSKVGKERALVPERSQRWFQREVSAGSREKSAREVNPGVSKEKIRVFLQEGHLT